MLYKLIKYPFFGDYMVEWRNPLTEDQKKEWKKIEVKSKSGALISGLFAKSKTSDQKATIVLGHPMGKKAKGYYLKRGYTDLLRNDGFNVLVFDINGFGESTHGNFSYFEDIVAISIKAKELTPEIPVGYHGISLGAMWGTIAFADETHQIDFAIVESSATTLAEFWIHFPFAYRVLKFMNFMMPKYEKEINMISRIEETKRLKSILFIYSEKDDWVPIKMGERFNEKSNVSSELWLVKTAKHAEIMKSEEKDVYQKKILSYFNKCVNQ